MKGKVVSVSHKTASDFLLPRHYSGRVPSISKAFGWKIKGDLVAVCTFGKPASPNLCVGVAGEDNAESVYELNRLCRIDGLKEQLSQFVSACLRRLRFENWIIVSYADSEMSHSGYIYQACNFIYTGMTTQRTDKFVEGNKHSRHYDNDKQGDTRKVRSAKHRYVFFCTHSKRTKKSWKKALRYDVSDYPKTPNAPDYKLGDYKPISLIKNGEAIELEPPKPKLDHQEKLPFFDSVIEG